MKQMAKMRNLSSFVVLCFMASTFFFGTSDVSLMADQSAEEHYVSADKNLDQQWLNALWARGQRKIYRGDELYTIGMPCGGVCTGQLYVRGDGTLARWWIFNEGQSTDFRLKDPQTGYRTYRPLSRLQQGFAICAQQEGGPSFVLPLSQEGFDNIGFIGEYPIATILYEQPKQSEFPVAVQAEVFSPFVPINTKDSAIPATVLRYTVANPTEKSIKITMGGWLQNAAMLNATSRIRANRRNRVIHDPGFTATYMDLVNPSQDSGTQIKRIKIIENFETSIVRANGTSVQKGSFDKWRIQGDGFGRSASEVARLWKKNGRIKNLENYEGLLLAFSGAGKNETNNNKMTSKPFTIEEDYLAFLIGGGKNPKQAPEGATCVNLLIDEEIVRTSTADGTYKMALDFWDVEAFKGKQARFEIVDTHAKDDIMVDYIHFCNFKPQKGGAFPEWDPEFGNMSIAVLDAKADASADWNSQQGFFDALKKQNPSSKSEAQFPITAKPCGTIATRFELAPGEKKSVNFLITWYFPNLYNGNKGCPGDVGRMYSNWYTDALDVARYVSANFDQLYQDTTLFRDSLYLDTTLPYWLVQRAAMSSSTLASCTVQWWKSGRFYSFEGVGFCIGTCGHVWNYAQGPARLFPELERFVRTMQDYHENVSFKNTGRINFRGFNDNSESFENWGYIPDAQAGYVLKAYREHLMSADYHYLDRLWPKIKKATEYLIERDGRYGPINGILEGMQHLTDSLGWGPNTFSGSLYLAALRAAEEMALLQGDKTFAVICHQLYESGRTWSIENLWNGEYFIHKYVSAPEGGLPKNHKGRSYGNGCLADQVFGQNWAHQLGLGYIYPEAYIKQALKSVFKYNWTPDVATVYKKMTQRFILLANEGEPGMVGVTYPKGDPPDNRIDQNDDPWTGYEYQAASHMLWEGLLQEGLSIAYGVHQRYNGTNHNPWCEIEGGDHYSRAMSSWGLLLGASGYRCDGPAGKIGFAPRMNPDDFRSFFSAAEGWGSIMQKREKSKQTNLIDVRCGKLRLKTLIFELPQGKTFKNAQVKVACVEINSKLTQKGKQVIIDLANESIIKYGQNIEVTMTW